MNQKNLYRLAKFDHIKVKFADKYETKRNSNNSKKLKYLYNYIDNTIFDKSSPKECVNSILAQTQIKRPLDLGLVY